MKKKRMDDAGAPDRRDRWLNERFSFGAPDERSIPCNGCRWSAEDRTVGDKLLRGCTFGTCRMYKLKPGKVLFAGAVCQYRTPKDQPLETEPVESIVKRLREKYGYEEEPEEEETAPVFGYPEEEETPAFGYPGQNGQRRPGQAPGYPGYGRQPEPSYGDETPQRKGGTIFGRP